MKLSLVIFLVLFIEQAPVRLTKIKSNYRKNETINYSIVNQSTHSITIMLSLMAQINGKWQVAVKNIGNDCPECIVRYQIPAKSRQKMKYDLNKLDKSLFQKNELNIMIKVNYLTDLNVGFKNHVLSNQTLVTD